MNSRTRATLAALDEDEHEFDTRVMGERSALAADVVERVTPVALAGEHRLPVLPPLEALMPEGLRRGTIVGVAATPGATSLALALAAGPSRAGSWVAAVGVPSLGLVAGAELGLALERLAMVAAPAGSWATVVAALVDAFDVVVLGRGRRLGATDGRRLAARARERGAVLVGLGEGDGLEADARLRILAAQWSGVGRGDGHLTARRMSVEASGRRAAARIRRADLWLPAPDGRPLATVDEAGGVVQLRPAG
jgi:hypothetical protein